MEDKDPINVLKSNSFEKLDFDSSMLVPIKAYKSSFNVTKPFYKPISKIV